jgi:hypothetical protein
MQIGSGSILSVDPDPIWYLEGQYSHEKLSCFEELLLELGRRSFGESGSATLFLNAYILYFGFRLKSGWR